ncbi:hypothetical protein HED63_23085 [Ochrobactrum cytisi]|nr:hypothetical protein [Brucella cytisi]
MIRRSAGTLMLAGSSSLDRTVDAGGSVSTAAQSDFRREVENLLWMTFPEIEYPIRCSICYTVTFGIDERNNITYAIAVKSAAHDGRPSKVGRCLKPA